MIAFRLVAVALTIGLPAPSAGQSVRAGIEAWQSGDHARAVSTWRPLAEDGDADAAFNLGQAYRLGRGVPVNLAAAQTWLERAARKDHVEAQSTLGLLLFDSGNRAGGLRWLKAAAEGGEPRALLVFGTALYNGDGVQRDPVLAYAYVSRAAAQGFAPAKATLEDLDRLLPLEQRQKGVQVALAKARPAPAAPAPRPSARPETVGEPRPRAQAARGAWRIQLGAFTRRSSAEALFKRLGKDSPVAGLTPYFLPAGAVTRLQAGPFATRAAAAAACARLSARGQACFAVAAK